MKKAMLVAVSIMLIASFFALVYPAMAGLVKADSNATAYSPVKDGLQLSISLEPDQTELPQGINANVTLTMTNVSNQTITVEGLQSYNVFNFQVYNSSDNKLLYTWIQGAYPTSNVSYSLAPNENFSESFVWGEIGGYNVHEYHLPLGSYYLVGDTGAFQTHKFQTDPLNITIVEPTTSNSPSSPTPTVTVPEFPAWIIVPLFVNGILLLAVAVGVVVYFKKIKR